MEDKNAGVTKDESNNPDRFDNIKPNYEKVAKYAFIPGVIITAVCGFFTYSSHTKNLPNSNLFKDVILPSVLNGAAYSLVAGTFGLSDEKDRINQFKIATLKADLTHKDQLLSERETRLAQIEQAITR